MIDRAVALESDCPVFVRRAHVLREESHFYDRCVGFVIFFSECSQMIFFGYNIC